MSFSDWLKQELQKDFWLSFTKRFIACFFIGVWIIILLAYEVLNGDLAWFFFIASLGLFWPEILTGRIE